MAPGHSYNSGAALFQSTGYPTVTLDSKLSFNEVSFGFVPHGGTSFYLSRLPGELGTFLALTGFPLTGIDARELGIADSLVHYSQAYEEELVDILFAMEFPVPNYDLVFTKAAFRSGLGTDGFPNSTLAASGFAMLSALPKSATRLLGFDISCQVRCPGARTRRKPGKGGERALG